jgi:hypothetical protein
MRVVLRNVYPKVRGMLIETKWKWQGVASPLFPRYGINDVVEGATDHELYVTRQPVS